MAPAQWNRVEEVFLAAIELPIEARSRFLDDTCGSDSPLRESVERLLANAGTFDAAAIVEEVANSLAAGDSLIGRQIGHYRITAKIGAGGMGAVYRAERGGDYNQVVAIKLIKVDIGDDQSRARFRRERQILALLEHPHIARLLDGGSTAGGAPYLVMEFVQGEPLLVHCARLALGAKLRLFTKLCEAVHFAHQRPIVHRDIKPGNVLVTADGSPKLLDFGIAKIATPEDAAGGPTSTLMMTPDYASPEQVRGEAVTTATDIYALGCVLYEILTGQRMHDLRSVDPLEIYRVVCETEPPPPSTIGSRESRGDLDTIVLKAVQKEAARRYRSAQEFADDIDRYLAGSPVLAKPNSLTYRARKYVYRYRLSLGAATAVICALGAGLWTTRQQAQLAERRFEQTRKLANRIVADVYPKVENLMGSLEARQTIVETSLEYLDALRGEASSNSELAWEVAHTYLRISEVQNPDGPNAGKPNEALASLEKAFGLAMPLVEKGQIDVPRRESLVLASRNGAMWAVNVSQQAKALAIGERAVNISAPLRPGMRAAALDALAVGQAASGKTIEAIGSWDKAISLARSELNEHSPPNDWRVLGYAADRRARSLILVGRLEEAEKSYRDNIQLWDKLTAHERGELRNTVAKAVSHEMLGTVLGLPDRPNLGRPKEGIEQIDRALAQIVPLVKANAQAGGLWRHVAVLWGKRAAMQPTVALSLRDLDNCRAAALNIADARQQDHVMMSYLGDHGYYLSRLNRFREALADYEHAIAIAQRQRKREPDDRPAHRYEGDSTVSAAEMEAAMNRIASATERYGHAVTLLSEADRLMPADARYLNSLVGAFESRANFWTKLGENGKAQASREAALAVLEERAKHLPGSKAVARLLDRVKGSLRR